MHGHCGLAGARRSLYDHVVLGLFADDFVLLLLDCGNDLAQHRLFVPRQIFCQQFIVGHHIRIVEVLQLIIFDLIGALPRQGDVVFSLPLYGIRDILFGDYNPGGKLTVTFPKSVGQIPFNFPCKPSSQIDGGKNPGLNGNMSRINGALYPFGYGLSYTTFEYSDLDITPRVITPNESATVRLKVTNTGKRAGDEVVQLYIRDVLSSITTYEKNLAGFQRIHLEPGETQELSFTIDRKHLELLDADMKWVVEPGDFVLMAGASSEDIRLNGTLTVEDYQTRAKAIEVQKPTKRVNASTNPEDAENVLDEKINTVWQGNKGDYITFALKNGAKVDKVAIAFTRDNNLPATFEIQLSGGGGQFLTVYSGTVSEYGKLISYPFKGTTASDLRIVLNDDRVGIAEVKF